MADADDQKTADSALPATTAKQFPILAVATSIVVPVTMAILGYYGKEIAAAQQREIEEAKLRYSYVTLIVDILQKKTDKTDQNIVCWSWRNLSAHSKAPFTETEITNLCGSKAALPEDIQFGAPRPQPVMVPSSLNLSEIGPAAENLFRQMVIDPARTGEINASLSRILANRARYETVQQATGVPWQIVGILHMTENDGDFAVHPHNGDPLADRTVRVPRGRPTDGVPPFLWETSAIDFIKVSGLDRKDALATIGAVLFALERHNGFGYRRSHSLNSPYVWACTNHYKSGLYLRDGVFSSTDVRKGCGAAPLLKAMIDRGLINVPYGLASN